MNPVDAIRSACALGQLPAAGRLAVGFSGGPDSAALLHALCALGGRELLAIHVDHGLRGDSAGDAERARQMAACWGAAYRVVRLEGLGPGEGAARDARHRALADQALEFGAAAIALGHHADDQLETLILRLLRGAGGRGLVGMRPSEPGPAGVLLVRPLLSLTRADIEAYCRDRALAPLADPTNADPAHASRNLLRHQVVPVLRRLNPRVALAAARTAAILADDQAALEAAAGQALANLGDEAGRLRAAGLSDLPAALARRVMRRLAPGLDFEQTEALRAFARGGPPGHTHLPGGRLLVRSDGWIWIGLEAGAGGEIPGASSCRRCLTRVRADPSMEPGNVAHVCPEGFFL